MPNVIKYSTSPQTLALKSGDYWIGTGDVPKGPTSSSDYWNGITPPTSGYTIYINKASQGPSIYTPLSDSDLIVLTNMIGGSSFTSTTQCFNWYNTQSDKMVFNKDYPAIITSGIVSNMDATFLPSYSTSGVTWYDLSPTGNNATLTNGPTYSSSENGSIVFDGTNDYAVFTRPSTIVTSGAISIAIWVKWTTVGTTNSTIQALVDNNHSFNNGFVIQDRPDISKYLTFSVRPTVSNPNGVVSTFQVGNGRWHYIVGTNDLTTSRLYIDGYLNAAAAESGGIINAQPNVSVGYWQGGPGRYLNGNVKQVSLYNRALSSAEILQNFYGSNIVTSGLVLYLDAGNIVSYPQTGTAWYDISSGGNNGTLTNGPTFDSANGGSIVFDGINDYVTLGIPSLLNGVQVPLSICMWAKSNSFANIRTLWGVYSAVNNNRLYSLFRLDTGVLKYYASTSSGGFQLNGTFTPTINTWNFYAVTVSGTLSSPSVTIYLNTSSENFSYAAFTSSPNLTVDFRVGGNQALLNEGWNGNISNAMWYNRALSATEISQNYNATKSRYGL
jgi:hypothetical protein